MIKSVELASMTRSSLDDKVLEYIKVCGIPDETIYGFSGNRFTAKLSYNTEEIEKLKEQVEHWGKLYMQVQKQLEEAETLLGIAIHHCDTAEFQKRVLDYYRKYRMENKDENV